MFLYAVHNPTAVYMMSVHLLIIGLVTPSVFFSESLLSAHLDFFDGVDDKGILQVLHGALHPVVEWSSSFGKLKVQLVDGFKQLLSSLLSIKT